MRTIDNIKTIVRAIPLEERLLACCDRIGRMARETKGPRMSIPVEPGDDDIFITTTIEEAWQMWQARAAKEGKSV